MIFIDSFVEGCYRVRSLSGKQGLNFEDSDQFGPSLINMRTGDIIGPIPEKSWFWKFYRPWREAGRPTDGSPMSSPCGPLQRAKWVETP